MRRREHLSTTSRTPAFKNRKLSPFLRCLPALFTLSLCIFLVTASQSQGAPKESRRVKKEKKALSDLKRSIQREKNRLSLLKKEEHSILLSLDTIKTRLNLNKKEVLLYRKKLKNARSEEKKIKNSLLKTGREIENSQKLLFETLRRIYKKGQFSYLKFLFSAEAFSDFLLRVRYADKLSAFEAETIEELERQRKEFKIFQKDLKEKKESIKTFLNKVSSRQRNTKEEIRKKKSLIRSIKLKKGVHKRHITESKRAQKKLESLIRKLKSRSRKTPTAGKAGVFKKRRGKLGWPVKGKLISSYGKSYNKKFKARSFNNGIEIRVKRGSPIRAVHDGKIIFADWFRGYGKLIVLDNGSGFYTLYGHLDKLLKRAGGRVKTGETLGLSGDTDSISGNALYFGIRSGGKPVNPLKWLRKR